MARVRRRIAKVGSKYGNKRTNGYASKREAKRAAELKLLEKASKIRHIREQVRYQIVPAQYLGGKCVERAVHYVADFVYEEAGELNEHWGIIPWQEVVEDAKGHRTPDYIIKRKLMLHVHGIRVREV